MTVVPSHQRRLFALSHQLLHLLGQANSLNAIIKSKGSGSINPMFRQEFGRLGGDVESADAWEREVRRLDVLTPGDFAVAARQYELWDSVPTAGELYEQLRQECVAKGAPAHPIGFAA